MIYVGRKRRPNDLVMHGKDSPPCFFFFHLLMRGSADLVLDGRPDCEIVLRVRCAEYKKDNAEKGEALDVLEGAISELFTLIKRVEGEEEWEISRCRVCGICAGLKE